MEEKNKKVKKTASFRLKRPPNAVLIGVGAVFLVLLTGALVVTSTLLYQFIGGHENIGGEGLDGYPQSVLVIRDTPVSAGNPGGADAVFPVSDASRAVIRAAATVRIYSPGEAAAVKTSFGVVMNENGYIVTGAAAALSDGVAEVTLSSGASHRAVLVGYDLKTDIAVLKIEAGNLRTAPFGAGGMQAGDRFLYIGMGQSGIVTVSEGMIGGKGSAFFDTPAGFGYAGLTATDRVGSVLYPGGVIVNEAGQVVGFRNMYFEDDTHFVYAISAADAKAAVDGIIADGRVTGRKTLGFRGFSVSATVSAALGVPRGVMVEEVEPGGSLEEADILPGDIITAIGGVAANTVEELQMTALKMESEWVTLRVYRPSERGSFEQDARLLDDPGVLRRPAAGG